MNTVRSVKLSPSGADRIINCEAGFAYRYILPNMDTSEAKEVANFGRKFHQVAEHDFDIQVQAEMLAAEEKAERDEIAALAKDVQSRWYFEYPARREERLTVEVGIPENILSGFPDRVCDSDDKHIIVDYKTSAWPNIDKDLRQIMQYAYMLWITDGVDPETIEVILDYPRFSMAKKPEDCLFHYRMNEEHLLNIENYLKGIFARARRIMDMLDDGKDVTKLTHSPGNCKFCPMLGRCSAYQVIANPIAKPHEGEMVSTVDLIHELIEREEAVDINSSRTKALKRAILARAENDGTEPDGTPSKELIEQYYSIEQRPRYDYPTQETLRRIMPKRIEKAVRSIPFSTQVDMQVVSNAVIELMSEALPASLKTSNIPKEYRKRVEDLRRARYGSPFLKQKD